MKIKTLACAFCAILLAACAANTEKSKDINQPDSLTVSVDSVSNAPTEIKPTTVENIALAAFEVKGPVRHIFTNNDWEMGMLTKFDKNGKLIYRFNRIRSYDIKITDSEIVLTDTPDGCCTYKVANGRLVANNLSEANLYKGKTYQYKNGELTQIDEKEEDEADGTSSSKSYSVRILSTDSHGNWTSRMVGNTKQERKIDYYDGPQAIYDLPFNEASYELNGTIGGDKYAVMTLSPHQSVCSLSNGKRDLRVKSYSPETGKLVLDASLKGNHIGEYEGKLSTDNTPFVYEGVFKNVKGGTVNFKLSLAGPVSAQY